MRKIYYELDIGYCGCSEEGVIEVAETATNSELDDMVHDMAQEYASGWEGDERLGFDADWDTDEYQEQVDSFYENVSAFWRDATEEDIENYA